MKMLISHAEKIVKVCISNITAIFELIDMNNLESKNYQSIGKIKLGKWFEFLLGKKTEERLNQ